MRARLLMASVLAVTGLLTGVASVADAAPDDWAGSRITSPATTADPNPTVSAVFVRDYSAIHRLRARIEVSAPGGLAAGCSSSIGSSGDERVVEADDDDQHHIAASLTTNCNGTYNIKATATLQCALACGLSSWTNVESHVVNGTINVAAPPPAVTDTSTTRGDGRSVIVRWSPLANPPPDFLDYRVERVSANGTTVILADISDRGAGSYTDADPPAEGGATTYRVYARRSAPGGPVASAPASSTASVDPAPPSTTPGTGGPAGPGGPGTAGPGGAGNGGTVGSGGVGGSPASRAPRAGTPSRNFFPPLLSPPGSSTDPDLPFEDREPGGDDPVLPDDDLASGPVEEAPSRGLAIPLATGLVLATWALHLRFLARAAKPEYLDASELPELPTW